MIFYSIITICSLLLLSPSHVAYAASTIDRAAINCSRGGASIDGHKNNKRFSLNRLKHQLNRTSQLDRRRRDTHINNKYNKSISSISKSMESGKSITISQPRKSKKIKMYITCISIVVSWLSLSTLFYAKFYDWPYPQVSKLHIHMNNVEHHM